MIMTRKEISPISVWRPIDTNTFLMGVPHYPEHVDESYWVRDAERIADAGFNVVRLGEFAWHIFEPKEGHFDFDLFDRAIEILGEHGINTIMCTPTAIPPRWLTQHYPEVLRVDENGKQASHGSRQHADTSSPVFRTHSKRITDAMAAHYKDNKYVVGWQTDNELNTSVSTSYSASTRREFQTYLEGKYATIADLNFAWGGDFWATAYDNFDQIVLPIKFNPGFLSPGHVQDYHRFLAFTVARFQHDQVEILRATNSSWFIFHNLGRLDDIDFRGDFTKDLDFVGYDMYPFLYDEMQRIGGHAEVQAMHLDICRGFAGNFIVPEQQSGFGSQPAFSTLTPEPGEMRRMAMSSVAHGADGLLFFRWRPAHFGAEIYWMGIIDHDDIPRRRFNEAKQFAQEMAKVKDDILGTHVRMDVGIAGSDFDNQEAHKTYEMGLPSPQADGVLLHQYCYRNGIAAGFIHPEDDLSPLKILYVPHWLMWKPEWTEKIQEFASHGGTVIISARTGTRDENNHIHRETAPGAGLSELAGITVEEFGMLTPVGQDGLFKLSDAFGGNPVYERCEATSTNRQYKFKFNDEEFVAGHMYEHIKPAQGTDVLGRWSNRFLEGEAIITSRSVGKGRVIYLGTYLTKEFVDQFTANMCEISDVVPLIKDLPKGVEVTMRQGQNKQLLFVQNTTDQEIEVNNLPAGIELLAGLDISNSSLKLGAYDCAIIKLF